MPISRSCYAPTSRYNAGARDTLQYHAMSCSFEETVTSSVVQSTSGRVHLLQYRASGAFVKNNASALPAVALF